MVPVPRGPVGETIQVRIAPEGLEEALRLRGREASAQVTRAACRDGRGCSSLAGPAVARAPWQRVPGAKQVVRSPCWPPSPSSLPRSLPLTQCSDFPEHFL